MRRRDLSTLILITSLLIFASLVIYWLYLRPLMFPDTYQGFLDLVRPARDDDPIESLPLVWLVWRILWRVGAESGRLIIFGLPLFLCLLMLALPFRRWKSGRD